MNVHQVKFLSWLTAVGLTAGLGYYVYDYTTGMAERPDPWNRDLAQEILGQEHEVEGLKVDLVDMASVLDIFHEFDWTGKPAPIVVERPKDNNPPPLTATPVSELVQVFFIQEDSDRPEGSSALIGYLPKSRVKITVPKLLKPGHRLADPLGYIRIEDIGAFEGVTFAFDDEERQHESLNAPDYDPKTVVVRSGANGVILPQRGSVPRYSGPDLDAPPMTKEIGRDHFQLGTEDMYLFGDDYAEIIAREVRHRRHKDPKTGRYDGIELQDVKAGGTVERHGGQSGDVIKSINGEAVTSVSEAITFVKNNGDKYDTWIVVVENMGRQRTVKYDSPPKIQR